MCKKKVLRVLIVHDDELDEEEGLQEEIEIQGDEEAPRAEKWGVAELSANLVLGLTSPHMMKLRGTIKEQDVVVLIDGGATHNFIAAEVVCKLNIPLTSTARYEVVMGTGISVKGVGICKHVELLLQGVNIVDDFLPLPLGNADIILGV